MIALQLRYSCLTRAGTKALFFITLNVQSSGRRRLLESLHRKVAKRYYNRPLQCQITPVLDHSSVRSLKCHTTSVLDHSSVRSLKYHTTSVLDHSTDHSNLDHSNLCRSLQFQITKVQITPGLDHSSSRSLLGQTSSGAHHRSSRSLVVQITPGPDPSSFRSQLIQINIDGDHH